MPLSDTKIRTLKPREKAYKQADERGLFLFITSQGSKLWRFKYRFAGKEKLLAIGKYPDVSLADARSKRDEARKLLTKDIDPGLAKQAIKNSRKLAVANSYEVIAREWHAKICNQWDSKHAATILRRMEKDIFPWLGNKPICEITAPDILTILRRIESRGAAETTRKNYQTCGQVFRYAIATGRADRNPVVDLRGALQSSVKRHFATITDPKEIGKLLLAIDGYQGYFVTKCALRLAPLFFVRPGELRRAEWSEFNFAIAEWHIPAEKMKMRSKHIVPLSTQAISILQELQPLTGNVRYLFPSTHSLHRPMSENTVNTALRRLGYTKDEMTGHGFRSMASTLLNEQGWNRDAIERQLAHAERNSVRAAYNYAEHLPERRKMMQTWADYLESLIDNSKIILSESNKNKE